MSSSDASGTGARMPTTVVCRPPSQTRPPGAVTPRRCAAVAPSTVAGSVAVAGLSHRPARRWAPTTRGTSKSAAVTTRPPVSCGSTASLRYTWASSISEAVAALSTPGIRRTRAAASAGSALGPPGTLTVVAVKRLVPSAARRRCRRSWLEAEMPTTATIAATPIATPSAESTARPGRVRRPAVPSRSRSAARNREGRSSRGVGDDAPVEDRDAARQARRQCVVVGDDQDRGAARVQVVQAARRCSRPRRSPGCRWARRRAAAAGRRRRRARWRPVGARRRRAGARDGRCDAPGRHAARRLVRARAGGAAGGPCRAARRRRCRARGRLRRGETTGTRSRCDALAAPTAACRRARRRPRRRSIPARRWGDPASPSHSAGSTSPSRSVRRPRPAPPRRRSGRPRRAPGPAASRRSVRRGRA